MNLSPCFHICFVDKAASDGSQFALLVQRIRCTGEEE